jgi:hypothetical protein
MCVCVNVCVTGGTGFKKTNRRFVLQVLSTETLLVYLYTDTQGQYRVSSSKY